MYEDELEDFDDEASNVALKRDKNTRLPRQRHQHPTRQERKVVDPNIGSIKLTIPILSR